MLIVNADDWGMDAATTDAIADAFAAGRISSATAMVHMADSERAARVARELELPLGLHLNLSEPYSGPVAEDVARLQRRLTRRFSARRLRLRRWLPDPTVRRAVDACVDEQLRAFRELHGRSPTHVDGHKHVHVSPTVAGAAALRDLPMRRAFDSDVEDGRLLTAARHVRHRATVGRHLTTDRMIPIKRLAPELSTGRIPRALATVGTVSIEVMVHPGDPDELRLLRSDAWRRTLEQARLGTFGDLR